MTPKVTRCKNSKNGWQYAVTIPVAYHDFFESDFVKIIPLSDKNGVIIRSIENEN